MTQAITLPLLSRSSDASQPLIFCLSLRPSVPTGAPGTTAAARGRRTGSGGCLQIARAVDPNVEALTALLEISECIGGQIERDRAGVDAGAARAQPQRRHNGERRQHAGGGARMDGDVLGIGDGEGDGGKGAVVDDDLGLIVENVVGRQVRCR